MLQIYLIYRMVGLRAELKKAQGGQQRWKLQHTTGEFKSTGPFEVFTFDSGMNWLWVQRHKNTSIIGAVLLEKVAGGKELLEHLQKMRQGLPGPQITAKNPPD